MKRHMSTIATIAALAMAANVIVAIPARYRFELIHRRLSAWRNQ